VERFQQKTRARVAILIPTRNRSDFLSTCVASLEQTVGLSLAHIIVIDHQPGNADSLGDLAEVRKRHRVVTHRRSFDLSAIIKHCRGFRPGALMHAAGLTKLRSTCFTSTGFIPTCEPTADRSSFTDS